MNRYILYVHKCGEMVYLIMDDYTYVGFADISKVRITICQHCLEVLTLNDLQLPDKVERK